MSRPTLAAVLTIAALFASPVDAFAKDLWAILEEFSGPGPFKGGSLGATLCFPDGIPQPSPLLQQDGRAPLWCVHGDRGTFASEPSDDRVFPRIQITLTEFGGGVRLHNGLDIGMSAGWMAFVTNDTRYKWVVTPVRVVVRPVLLLARKNPKKWYGIFSLYFKTPYVIGDITGEHFGAAPEAFTSDGEFVPSYGVTFDLAALIP